ncbi:hypothetical protein [Verrucosispora sp. WMMD573]|uniref:hypothetical protein n=1 Tax=Verrucosispora sp. WMMD573 TaxID=3015149 RepID=UPI00248C30A2|nr:hypothetical protein [Verrucosispora sp. WMMD573]WBB53828.1 hypothetical protein O7601_25230 [Verrucosispora sp. WMMD573]
MARNRARKADRRVNAIEAGVSYSKASTNRRDDSLQLCWEGCQSQYLAWHNAAGSMSWCAWGDHPVCMDCQRHPVIDEFTVCADCAAGAFAAEQAHRRAEEHRENLKRCRGECISVERLLVRTHPGQGADLADSASFTCAHCDNFLCLSCTSMPVTDSLDLCGPCGDAEMAGHMLLDDLPWAGHRRSEMRAELLSLVASIRRLSGLPFDVVNGRLNQAMKVARRTDADAEQLWAGIRAARLWLSALTASHRDA